jgi:hypothetical protein
MSTNIRAGVVRVMGGGTIGAGVNTACSTGNSIATSHGDCAASCTPTKSAPSNQPSLQHCVS